MQLTTDLCRLVCRLPLPRHTTLVQAPLRHLGTYSPGCMGHLRHSILVGLIAAYCAGRSSTDIQHLPPKPHLPPSGLRVHPPRICWAEHPPTQTTAERPASSQCRHADAGQRGYRVHRGLCHLEHRQHLLPIITSGTRHDEPVGLSARGPRILAFRHRVWGLPHYHGGFVSVILLQGAEWWALTIRRAASNQGLAGSV